MLGAATMRSVGAQPGGLVRVTVTDPGRRPAQGSVPRRWPRVVPAELRHRRAGQRGRDDPERADERRNARPAPARPPASATCSGAPSTRCWPAPLPGRPRPRRWPGTSANTVSSQVQAQEPIELVNFGESVNFPLLFGGLLALFGAATMVHLLLVSVSRRRAEAGLLKVLGFVRYQVAAVVSWQATAVALVGIVAGVPLGIAAGKVALAGVRHELRSGAANSGGGAACRRARRRGARRRQRARLLPRPAGRAITPGPAAASRVRISAGRLMAPGRRGPGRGTHHRGCRLRLQAATGWSPCWS